MNKYKVKRVIAFSNETTWEVDSIVNLEYSGFVQLMLDADALELIIEEEPRELTELINPESNNDEKEVNKNVRNKRRV